MKMRLMAAALSAAVLQQVCIRRSEHQISFAPAALAAGATEQAEKSEDIERFCTLSVAAFKARGAAAESERLTSLGTEVDRRITELEAKIFEFKSLMKQRAEWSERATEDMAKVYSKMSTESAAAQISRFNYDQAAEILRKIEPGIASSILGSMDNEIASRITAKILDINH